MTNPGDELMADANMVFDRRRGIAAPADEVWPWLVQLGKDRAGWYLPRGVERLLPPGRRATRAILHEHQRLAVADRVPDYGGRDAWLEVAQIDPARALVYRTERRGTPFSWALLLAPTAAGSELHLRFRARLRSRGVRRHVITVLGDLADAATVELMIRGLRERVEPGARGRT